MSFWSNFRDIVSLGHVCLIMGTYWMSLGMMCDLLHSGGLFGGDFTAMEFSTVTFSAPGIFSTFWKSFDFLKCYYLLNCMRVFLFCNCGNSFHSTVVYFFILCNFVWNVLKWKEHPYNENWKFSRNFPYPMSEGQCILFLSNKLWCVSPKIDHITLIPFILAPLDQSFKG